MPVIAVDTAHSLLNFTKPGPLISIQLKLDSTSPPLAVAVPVSVTELAGKVIVWLEPALTVGGVGVTGVPAAGSTVTVIDAFADLPLLSVA
jgi:hypothetical protein